MNANEEAALLSDLRRRGEQIIAASALSCSIEDYRKAARRVGREHGWRIRTFLVADGAAVAILWVDREKTEARGRGDSARVVCNVQRQPLAL